MVSPVIQSFHPVSAAAVRVSPNLLRRYSALKPCELIGAVFFEGTVTETRGLHVRPSKELVRIAQQFVSEVYLVVSVEGEVPGARVSLKVFLRLQALGIPEGANVLVFAKGPDQSMAIKALAEAFSLTRQGGSDAMGNYVTESDRIGTIENRQY